MALTKKPLSVKTEKKEEKPFNPVIKPAEEKLLCECGKEVLPKNHQCWDCSHRS